MQKKIVENSEGSSSRGKVAWEGDPYSQVLGKEKHGYVRGVGLGPSASEIFKARFEGLRMTTFDETTVEKEMRQMKEHAERLEKQLHEQNNAIMELKNMVQCLANGRAIEVTLNDKRTFAYSAIVYIVLIMESNLLFFLTVWPTC